VIVTLCLAWTLGAGVGQGTFGPAEQDELHALYQEALAQYQTQAAEDFGGIKDKRLLGSTAQTHMVCLEQARRKSLETDFRASPAHRRGVAVWIRPSVRQRGCGVHEGPRNRRADG